MAVSYETERKQTRLDTGRLARLVVAGAFAFYVLFCLFTFFRLFCFFSPDTLIVPLCVSWVDLYLAQTGTNFPHVSSWPI